ncbi:S-adenosylmethionine transporter [Zopfochytrium polystomum]|nr:S-adenosylmethionine transporter [Zopfochytrium polystomum]
MSEQPATLPQPPPPRAEAARPLMIPSSSSTSSSSSTTFTTTTTAAATAATTTTSATVATQPAAPSFLQALVAGGVAGTSVDTVLFPLDTIKTRLQSKQGFHAAGGFKGIYRGLSSAVIGSAPGASMFFVTYETLKKTLRKMSSTLNDSFIHMAAASGGEVMACIVRVPTEVVKQRMQTGQYKSVGPAVSSILKAEGLPGLYRGYSMTIFREIPFTCVQFPLYEYFKRLYARKMGRAPSSLEAAVFGSISGGTAAAVTTPLDVVKTRIMLSQRNGGDGYHTIPSAFRTIVREEGPGALFKGITPRVTWISMGGAVFLGTYELVLRLL